MPAPAVMEAIQVVECRDQSLVETASEPKRIIKTIARFKNGPSLEEIFLGSGFKDLPILVFSITGKTRGGKSVLLNLMIKYLESQEETNWLSGSVPNGFAWRNGLESVTRGLWVWPKVYIRKNSNGQKVGILLLDNEGMFDGEASDGEIIAMSGISTAMSYIQMFNLKEKISTDNLESIVRNLMKGIEEIDPVNGIEEMEPEIDAKLQKNYRLMFVVRDWMGEDDYDYGLLGGLEYIQGDRVRGSYDNKALWTEVRKAFSDVQCVLLPHPGLVATKAQFTNTGNLELLDPLFVNEVKTFVETLFAPSHLTLPQDVLTGDDIYRLLLRVDGKVADDNLSFMNMFTDHANDIKVENFRREFESTLLFSDYIEDSKSAMNDILNKAEGKLKGKSASEHFAKLKMTLEGLLNRKVVEHVLIIYEKSYEYCFNVGNNHNAMWRNILLKLREYLCGDRATVAEAKRKIAQKTANIYYAELHKEVVRNFKSACEKKDNLKSLAGLDERTITTHFEEHIDFEYLGGAKGLVHPIYFHHQQLLKDEITGVLLEKISSLTEISVEWLTNARKQQYEHFENFTLLNKDGADRNQIQRNDSLLHNKIGYALFGCPSLSNRLWRTSQEIVSVSLLPSTTTNFCSQGGYSSEQKTHIENIAAKIKSLNAIEYSCVFLTFHQGGKDVSSPLFRIVTPMAGNQFIDSNCRVYKDFEVFMQSNLMPDVVYCYPLNLRYDREKGFFVAFAESPASNLSNKVLKVSDTAGNVVTNVAGAAGAAALAAPLVGVALPVVGAAAVVGGGIAGAYGLARGIAKIQDKTIHEQPVTVADCLNIAANALAVVGAGAQKVLSATAKFGQSLISLSAFATLLTYDDIPELILLYDEIDNALKILFYFNALTSADAIKVIKKTLGMDMNSPAEEVLVKVVEINSIQASVETKEGWKMEKYVSKNVATLVASLLKTVRPEILQAVISCAGIQQACQSFMSDLINHQQLLDDIQMRMERLFESLQAENKQLIERVGRLVCDKEPSNARTSFLETISSNNTKQLILVLRSLVCMITSRIRAANKFYNNIEHEAVRLPGCDVDCHPLSEMVEQIRTLVDQSKSTSGLTSADDDQIDIFLSTIFDYLFKNAGSAWRETQFANWLLELASELRKNVDFSLNEHQGVVLERENLTCSHLADLFQEFEVEGNHGVCLMEKVLTKVAPGIILTSESSAVRVVPAWEGLLPRTYCYTNYQPQADKLVLVEALKGIMRDNYETIIPNDGDNSLCILKPSDEYLPIFVVYSKISNGIEDGLIWFDK